MKKWAKKYHIFLLVAILVVCTFGCAEISKETKVKCPKCGATCAIAPFLTIPSAIFITDEGLKAGSVGWKKSR